MKKLILCILILCAAFAYLSCDEEETPVDTTAVDEVIETPIYGGTLSTVIPEERILLYQPARLRFVGPAGAECIIMTESGTLIREYVGIIYDYQHVTHNGEVVWDFDFDESESPFYMLAVSYKDGNVSGFSVIEAEIKSMTSREIYEMDHNLPLYTVPDNRYTVTEDIIEADEELTVAELSVIYRGAISNADGDEREYVLDRVGEVIGREWRGEYYTYSDYAEYVAHTGDTDKNDYPEAKLELLSAAESIDDPAGAVLRFTAPEGVTCRIIGKEGGILTFGDETGDSFTLSPNDVIRWEPFAEREWTDCLPFDTEWENDIVGVGWHWRRSPYLAVIFCLDGDPFGYSVVSAYPDAEGGMAVSVFDGDALRHDMDDPVHYTEWYIEYYELGSIEEWKD